MLLPQKNPKISDITYLVNGSTVSRSRGGAFNFGYIPSGGTSKTLIVYLSVGGVMAIDNIKIYIKSVGNINFNEATFGVESLDYTNENFVPTKRFYGVNAANDPNSIYSIPVDNKNSVSSKYVYLNMSFPTYKTLIESNVIYGWSFDYKLEKA